MRRTPFASLTPAPPTIYFVPLRGTVFFLGGDVEVFMCVCPQKCLFAQAASSGGWQVLRRTPFASLTPAPPTIYFVPLRGTRILRAPPPARVRGWTRLRNTCHPPSSHMTKKRKPYDFLFRVPYGIRTHDIQNHNLTL